MSTQVYFPVFWLVVIALLVGILGVGSAISYYRHKIALDKALYAQCERQITFLHSIRWLLWGSALLLGFGGIIAWQKEFADKAQSITEARNRLMPVFHPDKIWESPDPWLAETDPEAELIAYGRDLIANTQDYFGEKGLVRPNSINGLNCQNCHLEAGSKPFGNNYFAVESTYPQMRARSGSLETIPKRINDCFQRSLNGEALDTTSREMKAIMAYMRWLGSGIPQKEKPKGAGLLEVPFLDRPADPVRGKTVYAEKCASCHGAHGQGLPIPESARSYPPLWGDQSYNEGAGLFRLSRFAGYVKANMPFGATYNNPQLSDEAAWDVAAYVNSQPRPPHPFLDSDWPRIEKKPFDHPFGPFADTFPAEQHKFGPFGPIAAFYKSTSKKN